MRAGARQAARCATLYLFPGDWLSGRALRSHRRGHWFDPSIAHQRNPRSDAHQRGLRHLCVGIRGVSGRNLGGRVTPASLIQSPQRCQPLIEDRHCRVRRQLRADLEGLLPPPLQSVRQVLAHPLADVRVQGSSAGRPPLPGHRSSRTLWATRVPLASHFTDLPHAGHRAARVPLLTSRAVPRPRGGSSGTPGTAGGQLATGRPGDVPPPTMTRSPGALFAPPSRERSGHYSLPAARSRTAVLDGSRVGVLAVVVEPERDDLPRVRGSWPRTRVGQGWPPTPPWCRLSRAAGWGARASG